MTIDNYTRANALIGNGSLDLWTGKVLGVAQALADGVLSWDATRAKGKGGFKGTTATADKVAAANPMLDELGSFAGQVTKIGKGILTYGAFVLNATDADREEEARRFASEFTLNQISELLYPKSDEDKWTLTQCVATMLAASRKRGIDDAEVLAEVVAQIEAN